MEVYYLNKFLTYANQKVSDIGEDEELMNLWPNLADEKEVSFGPYEKCGYLIYRAPGSRLIVSKDIELFYVGIEEFFMICLVADNRVYIWKYSDLMNDEPFSFYFCYENFMYWPKYKTLANFVYTLYNGVKDEHTIECLVNPHLWKFFTSHLAFSPDCVLGDRQHSNINTIELCCMSYGDYDDENLTCDIFKDYKPWDITTKEDYEIMKVGIQLHKFIWSSITTCMNVWLSRRNNRNRNPHIEDLEQMLYRVRCPFLDEGYKIAELSIDHDNVHLFKWCYNRYSLDRKRLKQWIPLFRENSVISEIRGIN